jgi:hypothetical protein
MRRLILFAVLAASFALYGNGAIACANMEQPRVEQTAVAAKTALFFEQAPASHDHGAHHGHRKHDERTPCDGTCCCHASSAGAALPASAEFGHLTVQSGTPGWQLPDFHPRQLSGEFYGPPKSFA